MRSLGDRGSRGELEKLKEGGRGELSIKDGWDRDAAEEVGSQACSKP